MGHGSAALGTQRLWPQVCTCALLPAELLGPAGGSLHSAHGGCPKTTLLQGMEPIDGGATWCAHVRPQLGRVLPLLQQHLSRPLGRGALGAGDLGEAPLLGPVVTLSLGPLGPLSLTSRVWAAMR